MPRSERDSVNSAGVLKSDFVGRRATSSEWQGSLSVETLDGGHHASRKVASRPKLWANRPRWWVGVPARFWLAPLRQAPAPGEAKPPPSSDALCPFLVTSTRAPSSTGGRYRTPGARSLWASISLFSHKEHTYQRSSSTSSRPLATVL